MLTPEQYPAATAGQILDALENGEIAFDHRAIRALLERHGDVARWANENADNDILDLLLELFRHRPTVEALPFLMALAGDLYDEMPEELLEAFSRLGAPALEPLLELYAMHEDEPGDIPFAIALLRVKDGRIEALLGRIAAADAQEGKFLREVYEDHGAEEPYDIFKHHPEEAAPDLSGLPTSKRLEFLSSPDVNYRLASVASFVDHDVPAEVAARLVESAKGDEAPQVRGLAWQALESKLSDPATEKLMLERLADASLHPEERAGLAVALAQRASKPGVRAAIEELYGIEEVRARAIEAMWRSFQRDFEPFITPHIEDANRDVQQQAILAAGYLNLSGEAQRLEKLFADSDAREDALFAYALCCKAEVSRAFAKKLYRQIDKLAHGLDDEEAESVRQAIDLRLEMHGLKPVFSADHDHEH